MQHAKGREMKKGKLRTEPVKLQLRLSAFVISTGWPKQALTAR
jgi:hypothetical protein